jgi:hypothetical protein
MELDELVARLATALEELGIPYFVTGSVATIAYGEPRFTNDVDIVVRLSPLLVDRLCAAFPEDQFYVSPEAVTDAINHSTQFNILHPQSGLKVDVMVADDTEFNASRFARTRRLSISAALEATFASPEDVIVKKLEYYRDGGSEKHLRDIAGVIKVLGPELDIGYLERWTQRLGLARLWVKVRRSVGME